MACSVVSRVWLLWRHLRPKSHRESQFMHTRHDDCLLIVENTTPDLAALKPMSAAASAKDRGYKPAPKATSALEEQITAGRGAAHAAGNGADDDMGAENLATGGNGAAREFDAGKQAARINEAMDALAGGTALRQLVVPDGTEEDG